MNYKVNFDRYPQPQSAHQIHGENGSIWIGDWEALSEYCQIKPVDQQGKIATELSSTDNIDLEWTGGYRFEDAVNALQNGWIDGVEKIPELDTVTSQEGLKIEYAFDVSGEDLDVGTFMSGDPECFLTETLQPSSFGKLIRIGVNIAASAVVTSEQLFNRGLAIMGLIDNLESMGYSCAIDIIEMGASNNSPNLYHANIYQAKKQGEPLNRENIVYAIAHPAMLRRIFFRLIELNNGGRNLSDVRVGHGLGKPASIETLSGLMAENDIEYDLIFNSNAGERGRYNTLKSAIETINQKAQQGLSILNL